MSSAITTWPGRACRLQAGGKVRRLAHDRLFLRRSGADEIAHHDQSRRDADPAGERRAAARQRRHGFADGQSSAHGPLGFVLMRPRPAEIGEHSVAHEFRDVAFEARDFAGHRVLVGAKQLPHLFRIEPARERGRSHEIDEHHGELPAFRAGRQSPWPGPARDGGSVPAALPSAPQWHATAAFDARMKCRAARGRHHPARAADRNRRHSRRRFRSTCQVRGLPASCAGRAPSPPFAAH